MTNSAQTNKTTSSIFVCRGGPSGVIIEAHLPKLHLSAPFDEKHLTLKFWKELCSNKQNQTTSYIFVCRGDGRGVIIGPHLTKLHTNHLLFCNKQMWHRYLKFQHMTCFNKHNQSTSFIFVFQKHLVEPVYIIKVAAHWSELLCCMRRRCLHLKKRRICTILHNYAQWQNQSVGLHV